MSFLTHSKELSKNNHLFTRNMRRKILRFALNIICTTYSSGDIFFENLF